MTDTVGAEGLEGEFSILLHWAYSLLVKFVILTLVCVLLSLLLLSPTISSLNVGGYIFWVWETC